MIMSSGETMSTDVKVDKNSWRALAVVCTVSFLVPFMGSSVNLALPQISGEFEMKAVTLTWMATAYLLSTAIFQIPFARISDLVGRKKVFITGVWLFCISSLVCGMARSGMMLIMLRFFSGLGSSMMFGTGTAIITSLFPAHERGKVLGINSATVYAALAAGPFLGGMITHYIGWRSIFFISAAVGGLVIIASHIFLKKEWVEAKGEKFDLGGSLLYGIGIGGVIFGFSKLTSAIGALCVAVGLISLVFFAIYEKRHSSPVLNVRLFSESRVFTLSSVASLINYAATAAIAFMLSQYLQYIRGFDARHAGLILITQACFQTIFSLVAGSMSNRWEASRMATAGMMIIVVGLVGLIFLDMDTPIWMILGILVMLGIGFGIFSSPNTNVVMSSVDRSQYSQASATIGTMRLTGQAFSIGIAGMAISFGMGNEMIVPELHPAFMYSMHITFVIFLCLCIVGVYASSARVKAEKNGKVKK